MYFFSDTNLSNKEWNATVNDGMEELGGLYTTPMIIFLSVFSELFFNFHKHRISFTTNNQILSGLVLERFMQV